METKNHFLKSISQERRYRISLFDDLEDNVASYGYLTFQELAQTLTTYTETEMKGEVPLFNSTLFKSKSRALSNSISSDLIIFDLDGKNYSYTKKDLQTLFKEYNFIAWETYSSNKILEQQRWRIVIPLERSITPKEYNQLYLTLIQKLKLDCDLATQQANAIFYLPNKEIGSVKEYFVSKNKANLNPDKYIKNTEIQRHNELFNTDIRITELSSKDSKSLCGFLVPQIVSPSLSLIELNELTSQIGVGLALASLIGLNVEKSKLSKDKFTSVALHSVMPWHEKDRKPSTGLIIKSRGENSGRVLYRSFKDEDSDNPVFDLHYIYACQQTGKRIPFERWTPSTSIVWLVRALVAANVIMLPECRPLKSKNALFGNLLKFYDNLLLLQRCRSVLSHYKDSEVAFSFSFAEVWCGLSRQTASKYFKVLSADGYIDDLIVETARMKINGFNIRVKAEIKFETKTVNTFATTTSRNNFTDITWREPKGQVNFFEQTPSSGLRFDSS
ncbi:MAG: hypothetical protein ACSHW0_18455 [Thalassotalea sp.]